MVVHDETQMQEWAQDREETTMKKTPARRLSVLAVQSIACGVIILLALLLRMAGGEAYASLRGHFQQALARNEWVTALAVLWDGNPLDKEEDVFVSYDKEKAFTSEEGARLMGLRDTALHRSGLCWSGA